MATLVSFSSRPLTSRLLLNIQQSTINSKAPLDLGPTVRYWYCTKFIQIQKSRLQVQACKAHSTVSVFFSKPKQIRVPFSEIEKKEKVQNSTSRNRMERLDVFETKIKLKNLENLDFENVNRKSKIENQLERVPRFFERNLNPGSFFS